jgi:hypothetical protein
MPQEQKLELAKEMLAVLLQPVKSAEPVPVIKPEPVFALYLDNGTIHDQNKQIDLIDVIMPVMHRQVLTANEIVNDLEWQRLVLDADTGCEVEKFNKCTRKWNKATIFCKLFIRVPNGTIARNVESENNTFTIGHTKSAQIAYFILPKGAHVVHESGSEEISTMDYMIRFFSNSEFILEGNTHITYGENGESLNFKLRKVNLFFNFADIRSDSEKNSSVTNINHIFNLQVLDNVGYLNNPKIRDIK